METNEIRFLGDLQRVKPEPGDVFVLTTERPLSEHQAQYLREHVSKELNGAKVLVLSEGQKLLRV